MYCCLKPRCGSKKRQPEGLNPPGPASDASRTAPEMRLRPLAPSEYEPETPSGVRRLLGRSKPPLTLDQTQSSLLGLPAEIRLKIWEYCLCANQLHIVRTDRSDPAEWRAHLVGIKCSKNLQSDVAYSSCNHLCWGKTPSSRSLRGDLSAQQPQWYLDQWQDSRAEEINFVALLRTCRQM